MVYVISYQPQLPFGIISPSTYIDIETMNIISADLEIN